MSDGAIIVAEREVDIIPEFVAASIMPVPNQDRSIDSAPSKSSETLPFPQDVFELRERYFDAYEKLAPILDNKFSIRDFTTKQKQFYTQMWSGVADLYKTVEVTKPEFMPYMNEMMTIMHRLFKVDIETGNFSFNLGELYQLDLRIHSMTIDDAENIDEYKIIRKVLFKIANNYVHFADSAAKTVKSYRTMVPKQKMAA